MKRGTKSVIAGAHSLLVHPLAVTWSWKVLFGFPWDPRIWCACLLHDVGYVGRDEMDGPSGEEHVVLGARIMGRLFGPKWARECYCHSRYWSRPMGLPVGRLGLADKLAFAMMAAWLYLPMARWTGELAEYMERCRERQAGDRNFTDEELALIQSSDPREWLRGLQAYTLRWVERQHAASLKDGLVRSLRGERQTT